MENSGNIGLYDRRFEHDACGIGAVADIKGRQSYRILDDALKIVERLQHRAGKDASGETGDGVGIMTQIPHEYFAAESRCAGVAIGGAGDYGVGMFFLPQSEFLKAKAQKLFEYAVNAEGAEVLWWRDVCTDASVLGQKAKECMPCIMQCFVARPRSVEKGLPFDRLLYVIRRVFEQSDTGSYVVSLSSRTIVYKGMFLVHQLRKFYADLAAPQFKTAFALVHSRFSTNTDPSWNRAHPNRVILHNGEINTIRGNADRMLAREESMSSLFTECNGDKVFPVVNPSGSDSAMLDNTLEFLMFSGVDLPLAVMMTIPEPLTGGSMSRKVKDFYRYHSTMMEPWDGPAAILYSDGDVVGAALDRNGLRPSRYYLTADGRFVLSSEIGVLEERAGEIIKKDRLRPGQLILIDIKNGKLLTDGELKEYYASRKPYGEWLDQNLVPLKNLPIPNKAPDTSDAKMRGKLYKAFGYSYEDIKESIIPMARDGKEPIASMGTDIPLAVLSEKHQPLFNYFKQRFAQVTNPPIDALREECVTDTTVFLGADGNLLIEKAENCRVIQINHPILTNVDIMKIRAAKDKGFKTCDISLLYYKNAPLSSAMERIFIDCDKAYISGANILVLTDRGVDENHMAVPSLLAVSAIEQHLVRTKKRTSVSIIIESAEPREVHHFALLLGYGARAVFPYLAHECICEYIEKGALNKDAHTAINDYNSAILHGIVKIASKMGVSTLLSYQSSQLFEAVGIKKELVDKYFTNTVSRIGGIGLEEIGDGVEYRHNTAFDPLGLDIDTSPDSVGFHKLRSGSAAEDHMYNPRTIVALREAVRSGDYVKFKQYSALVDDESIPHTLRGLLQFEFADDGGVPLSEVEPAESIVKRFKTGAMSYGSISKEAHECMATAMNRLGGKSNSGEGGEEPGRLGTEKGSAIKQVASGRFGVTSEYLLSAQELQIKMAQGAKPGEGGHLPGQKVYPWIAKTRHSTPGVPLISPPPHHDIYSIEDLAQLIYDLKNANRKARISVKLVSEEGVGTIAAGVAKAGAQVVLISGYDGGTGAAPKSSIYHAGLPWELGVAEAHQTLVKNGLRSAVVLETDGKLMSGRDVAIAALLGAEEFGFATAPLVTMGCIMMRVCDKDTCPAGIATQNPKLRERFSGKPEYVMNFMMFVAQELREIMAKLGVRTVNELVGRTDLLSMRQRQVTQRAAMIDLTPLLRSDYSKPVRFDPKCEYDFKLSKTLDEKVLLKKMRYGLDAGKRMQIDVNVTNADRTFGAILGSVITGKFGNCLPEDQYVIRAKGGGGQSFGAFIPKGLTITLEGESNDYFGKGLSGGKLIVYPPFGSKIKAEDNVIIGNVALYGATSGSAFISGMAGERFCVRNSGAMAVVEGIGDHGCEYMTGGTVVVLGRVGKNFAAGMSGGVAYIIDEQHDLYMNLNKELVIMSDITQESDKFMLKDLISKHIKATNSPLGKRILENWNDCLPQFKKIIPKDYSRIMDLINEGLSRGMTRNEAESAAFAAVK